MKKADIKDIMLSESMFTKNEFTVTNKQTGEDIGIIREVTNVIPNIFTALSIHGKEYTTNDRSMAMLFLIACKAERKITKKIDPSQRTMMDLL